MDTDTKDKLAVNVANSWKMASNWVITAAGAMFAIYLSLPADQQAALVNHLPVPPWVLPIVTSIIGITARLWPQKSITPAVAAAKSAAPDSADKDLNQSASPTSFVDTVADHHDNTEQPVVDRTKT